MFNICPKCKSANSKVIANGFNYHHKRKCGNCGKTWIVQNRKSGQRMPDLIVVDDPLEDERDYHIKTIEDDSFGGGSGGGGGSNRDWGSDNNDNSFDFGGNDD